MKFEPISGRDFPRFSAIKTFFRLPAAPLDADYDIGIFGTPYDGAVSYRPGARFGPTRIRELSAMGRGYHMTREQNWIERIRVADIGDCPTVPIDQNQSYERIENFVSELLTRGKKFISVGGDHSTTLPVLRALRKHFGAPLNLVHFDAHLDTYPPAWGCEYHHGAFVRHAVNEGLIAPERTLQIGIRGPLAAAEDLDFVRTHGVQVTTVDDVRMNGLEAFVKSLPAFEDGPTYISYDIDCLDPAFAPGTGTPVPGGLTTYETQRILRALRIENLVGADVVEVSPPFDSSDITALAAVDAMFEFLSIFAANANK